MNFWDLRKRWMIHEWFSEELRHDWGLGDMFGTPKSIQSKIMDETQTEKPRGDPSGFDSNTCICGWCVWSFWRATCLIVLTLVMDDWLPASSSGDFSSTKHNKIENITRKYPHLVKKLGYFTKKHQHWSNRKLGFHYQHLGYCQQSKEEVSVEAKTAITGLSPTFRRFWIEIHASEIGPEVIYVLWGVAG